VINVTALGMTSVLTATALGLMTLIPTFRGRFAVSAGALDMFHARIARGVRRNPRKEGSMQYLLPVLLGAFIGWVTNNLAIRMLFRPRKTFLGLQGVLVKRKKAFAEQTARLIEQDLLSNKDILKSLDVEGSAEKLIDYFTDIIWDDFRTHNTLDGNLNVELKKVMRRGVGSVIQQLQKKLFNDDLIPPGKISELIETKILSIPDSYIEELIRQTAKNEFKSIEITGAILGAAIGAINILI